MYRQTATNIFNIISRTRHRFLVTMIITLICIGSTPHTSAANPISYLFFEKGTALCEIVLPSRPQPEEQEAASLLQEVFASIGEVTVPVLTNPPPESATLRIHVGASPYAQEAIVAVRPSQFDLDGLIIHPADEHNLVLLGERPLATFYAVTEFLEEYAGVLWVWPGETGTVLPKSERLEVSVETCVAQPVFTARRFSGLEPARMRLWRIHQDARGHREVRGQHSHNVKRTMPWELWDKHPEYFSQVNGERRKPTRHRSQPCTTNPEVISLFAQAARRQFIRYPWMHSFSTSQGDGSMEGFCECDDCRALDVPGEPGLSDRWFTFVNAVAEEVAEEFPDYRIANLAYSVTKHPPARLKLHPNVLVSVVLPSMEEERDSVVKAWSEAAEHLGAYFWLHGKPVPKFYPQRFAEYLRFLRQHKFSEVYAEVYQESKKLLASWEIDGPRMWFFSKLLWNPEADIPQLMEKFLSRFYGPAAAPMRRYYEVCEAAWERRSDPFDFGLPYRDYELDLYTVADVEALLTCFDEAEVAAAKVPEVLARIAAQRNAWKPILGYYQFIDIATRINELPLNDAAEAETLVRELAERALRADSLTEGSPYGFMPPGAEEAIDVRFAAISAELRDGAESFWAAQAAQHPLLLPFIGPQLAVLRGEIVNIARNPGFEEDGEDKEPPPEADWNRAAIGWSRWMRAHSRGQVSIARDVARTGVRSLRIAGGGTGCAIHNLAVNPGERYRASCWAMSPDRSPENPAYEIRMMISWKTREGHWLPPHLNEVVQLPPETPDGAWRNLSTTVTVPPQAGRLLIQLGVDNQDLKESAYFDDITLELLTSAPEAGEHKKVRE